MESTSHLSFASHPDRVQAEVASGMKILNSGSPQEVASWLDKASPRSMRQVLTATETSSAASLVAAREEVHRRLAQSENAATRLALLNQDRPTLKACLEAGVEPSQADVLLHEAVGRQQWSDALLLWPHADHHDPFNLLKLALDNEAILDLHPPVEFSLLLVKAVPISQLLENLESCVSTWMGSGALRQAQACLLWIKNEHGEQGRPQLQAVLDRSLRHEERDLVAWMVENELADAGATWSAALFRCLKTRKNKHPDYTSVNHLATVVSPARRQRWVDKMRHPDVSAPWEAASSTSAINHPTHVENFRVDFLAGNFLDQARAMVEATERFDRACGLSHPQRRRARRRA